MMNYFKQGDVANADKIKAAFKAKRIEVLGFGFADKTVVYCSIGGVCVQTLPYSINLINILYSHPDYQELELPVEPKFRVGDSLQSGSMWAMVRRIDTENQRYICQFDNVIPFEEQDQWHLAHNPHYDITNFHAGMPVLVRADNNCRWDYSVFSRITGNKDWPFAVCNGVSFTQCIPYNDDTKHLLGTTDMCPEEYVNW